MAKAPLTKRQRQIFDFIAHHIASKGYAPSLAEIGEVFQLTSLATVHKHLTNLAERGWIIRRWNRSRSTEIVQAPVGTFCPTCGQVVERHEATV